MAQVKKLQDGGNPSKKYFMFNGTKIVEGDDNFKQLEQYALNGNRFAQRILETLPKSNNDIIVNTSDNGVDFKNLDMDYRNERTKKQFEKGDSFWRRTFRTKEGRDYINDAVELKFTPVVKEKEKEKEKLGTISHGNNASFIYHDQQDGSKLYSNGPQNIQNETIIRNIFNNLSTSRADLEKKYDFSNWGEDYWTLQDWKNLNPNYNVEDLISRIKQGKATDEDLELLTLMKFNTSFKKPDKKKLTGLEWDDAFSDGLVNAANLKQAAARRKVGIKKGEDGNWYVTGNSDFTNGTWYTGDLDFLEGTKYANGAIHNGRLFTKDQILNGDPGIMQYIAPFISAWRNASDYRTGYDAANKSGVRFVGDRLWNNAAEDHYGPFHVQFDPTSQYHKIWSKYFDDLNTEYPWNVTDVTNAYNNLNGKHVIAYIDPEERNKREFGLFGADWVVYDPNNLEKPYQVFDNETSMRNALGLTSISDPYGFTNDFETSTWMKIGDQEYALFDVIKTEDDQENTILIGADKNMYLARKDESGNPVEPKRIWNTELLQSVLANPNQYDNTVFDDLIKLPNVSGEGVQTNGAILSEDMRNIAKRSNGGILKHQYGGAIHSSKITSSTKNTEDAKTDITKSHRLDGKDGGLTQAEKMQIRAAFGDLTGVALSFAGPVGNVAGAATGLASTATRLIADIKHDGFQAKDAWNAAVGAVLDFASVIPFIGAGAKTAKALKVIKAAASPITKAFSLYGAYEGANAMSKVMAGENITSADLQSIISGLASTVVAGKQFKNTIGDSKLASMLSKKVADATNATKSLKPTATIDGKKIELDLDSVKDKSKSEVLKYIKKTSKDALGRELTDIESKDLLEKFGLSVNKGEYAGMRWKNILKGKNPVVRKSEKVNFDVPEDISGHGAFYYMFNPFARHKALGRGWHGFSNNKGLLSEVSKNDIKGAQRRIKNYNGSLKDYALMRRTIDNPAAFGNIFEGTPYRLPKRPGYPTYLRPLAPIWKQEWTPKMHPVFTADVDAPIKLGSHLNIQLDSQPNTDVLRRRAKIDSWKGKRLMQPTLTHPYGKYYDDVVIMEKQGGILKGQHGLNPKNYNLGAIFNKNIEKSVTPWAPGLSIAPVLNAKLDLTLDPALSGKQEPDVSRYIPSSILERSKTIQKKANATLADTTQKLIDANIPIKEQSEQGGGDSGEGSLPWYKKIEPSDILEAGRVFKSLADVNKLEDIKRKSINAAAFTTNKLQDTNHRYKLYTQPNLRPAVADSRLQSKLFQNSISDMKYAGLYNLSNENTLLKSMLSAASKDSEMINKQDYQKQQLDFERNAINTELSNLDLQRQASLRSAIEGLPAESLVQKSSILDKAGLYLQNRMFLDDKSKYIADQKSEYAATMYDKATTPEAKTYWQTKLSETQKPEFVSSIRKALRYTAKGGKLRSTSDQMLLDNQKLVAKAIEKMNDNTMKLILKALS